MKEQNDSGIRYQDNRAEKKLCGSVKRFVLKAEFSGDAGLEEINNAIAEFVQKNKHLIGKWNCTIK